MILPKQTEISWFHRWFQDAQCPQKALSAFSRSLATQRSLELRLMTLASSHLADASQSKIRRLWDIDLRGPFLDSVATPLLSAIW